MARGRLSERRVGTALLLELDRPPVNALDLPLIRALTDSLNRAGAGSHRVVVLTGRGRCFSAGVEVRDHLPEAIRSALPAFHDLIRAVRAHPAPVVARIHGPALGGGLELALACDLAVASESATFGFPEIGLACFPPVAAAWLAGFVGSRRATELILTGRNLNAREAHAVGLVSRVASDAELDREVDRVVERICALSPAAVAAAKAAIESADTVRAAALRRAEEIYLRRIADHPDAIEGIEAFLGKRPASWATNAAAGSRPKARRRTRGTRGRS